MHSLFTAILHWLRVGITLFQNDDDDSELGRSIKITQSTNPYSHLHFQIPVSGRRASIVMYQLVSSQVHKARIKRILTNLALF